MGTLPAQAGAAGRTIDTITHGAIMHAVVRFDREGWHNWPTAPDNRAYLRHPHRHLFQFEVGVSVGHQNREIEFHDLRDFCLSAVPDRHNHGSRSCELIARELIAALVDTYGADRRYAVAVFEDGENGAVVVLPPAPKEPATSVHTATRTSGSGKRAGQPSAPFSLVRRAGQQPIGHCALCGAHCYRDGVATSCRHNANCPVVTGQPGATPLVVATAEPAVPATDAPTWKDY